VFFFIKCPEVIFIGERNGLTLTKMSTGGAAHYAGQRLAYNRVFLCPCIDLAAFHAHVAFYTFARGDGWKPIDLFPWIIN
jgi:hypothetical protein